MQSELLRNAVSFAESTLWRSHVWTVGRMLQNVVQFSDNAFRYDVGLLKPCQT